MNKSSSLNRVYHKSIASLGECFEIMNEISENWDTNYSTTDCWYRGQDNFIWQLLPTLYRENGLKDFEREITRDFQLRAVTLIKEKPANQLEWLFVMQHYGMQTRLLDWTESYLTALFFAVISLSKTDSALWVLDPWSLNMISKGIRTIPTSKSKVLNDYQSPIVHQDNTSGNLNEIPIAVRPTHITERIKAQKGVFTIHGRNTSGLDQIADSNKSLSLCKIRIPGTRKIYILKELFRAGYTTFTLFPNLSGLSGDISMKYSNYFMIRPGEETFDPNLKSDETKKIRRPRRSETYEKPM